MGDIKLFHYENNESQELMPHYAGMEKELQAIIERNMYRFLGVRFLAHEYATCRPQQGFIDTLGLDENNCPVIVEYKRFNNVNIIVQGLYYLDWLMTHKTEFEQLAKNRLGEDKCGQVEFDGARVICMASAFGKYDEYAIQQINRNIELVRYKFYNNNMILLELVNSSLGQYLKDINLEVEKNEKSCIGMPPSLQERIRSMNAATEELYFDLLGFSESLGDDVNIRFLKHYISLSRLKNFTSIQPMKNHLKLWLNLGRADIQWEEGFTRDVSNIGHHASGNVEIEVRDQESLKRAQPYIEQAYRQN